MDVAFVGLGSRSFTGIPLNLHLHSILGPLLFRAFFCFFVLEWMGGVIGWLYFLFRYFK